MKKVEIYSTPSCGYCKMAKDFMNEHKVVFEEFDVASNPEKRNEMIEKSGQMGVPVIDIDGEMMVGFDRDALAKALDITI
jgi:glutaredoxin 3